MTFTVSACYSVSSEPSAWRDMPELRIYGAFKLGLHSAIDRYAERLALEILELAGAVGPERRIVLASPPHAVLPSAANLLTRRTASLIARNGGSSCVQLVDYRKRPRQLRLPRHYARLSEDDRATYVATDREAWIPNKAVRDQSVVIIDDIRITGVQERERVTFTSEQGATQIHCQYLFQVSEARALPANIIEPALNTIGVHSDTDFLEFIGEGCFTVTTRFLWRLLELSHEQFEAAARLLTPAQRAEVVDGARAEGQPDAPTGARLRRLRGVPTKT